MQDLKIREEKIKEKRKSTTWREFLMEIGSRCPLSFYKINKNICRYPDTNRINNLVSASDFLDDKEISTNIYNNSISFIKNFENLLINKPLPYLRQIKPYENCEFADTVYNAKNVYLSTVAAFDVENILYSHEVGGNCKNIFNSISVHDNSENIYKGVGITNSYNIFFSIDISDSNNIRYSESLQGCSECVFCSGLKNQSYCIENKQYTKEDYLNQKEKILRNKTISEKKEINGKIAHHCENVENVFLSSYIRNSRNVIFAGGNKQVEKNELYDIMSSGGSINNAYACMGVSPGEHFYCCINAGFCNRVYYSLYLENCSYCLGCIGLKNKQFCILNKQYTKEERYQKANEIFKQMESDGTLGNFFPGSMNPFYFNDTAAYLIDDTFTKEEVEKEGYMRRDEEIKVDIPDGVDVIETGFITSRQGYDESGNRHINPDIIKKVIKDEKGNFYRIVKMEYDFLMKYGLPLPEIHRLERIKLGFKFK